MTVENNAKGPGQGRGGNGFSFDDREGGRGGGKDRGRGGPGGRGGGRDRKEGAAGGASYRVVNELSSLEKALTKSDFVAMKEPLGAVLRAVKPLRLKSVEQLDLGTRGKLITSLMRAQRLAKPAASEAPQEAAAPEAAAPSEAPPAVESATSAEPVAASEAPSASEGTPSAEAAAVPVEAVPVIAPVDPKVAAWAENQFTVGLIWSSMNESDRAKVAFENAGRQPTEAELAVPAAPERSAAEAKAPRGDRNTRPAARGNERRERSDKPTRPSSSRPVRMERVVPFVSSGDWQADVKTLEELGRTRDAARIHEKNKSFADALRLFEAGGDAKAALRNAALGKADEAFARLSAKLKPEEIVEALERAEAWEKLMEFHVARADFEAIAKLYERASQFDQAGLAWERSGKLSLARKAYERAKDFGSAHRVRDLEVQKLIERGDRLGAATLQVGAGKRMEAMETLKPLPGPKAYHFMQKLKLAPEADAFAKAELAKAEAANDVVQKARWLELLGRLQEAADVYLGADRKDKAAFVFEAMGEHKRAAELLEAVGHLDKAQALFAKAGDTANVERVKALPRPEPKPQATPTAGSDDAEDSMPPPEASVEGTTPGANA